MGGRDTYEMALNFEVVSSILLAVAVVLLSGLFYWQQQAAKKEAIALTQAIQAEEDKAADAKMAAKTAKAEKAAARKQAAIDQEAAAAAAKKEAALKVAASEAVASTSSSAAPMSGQELVDAVLSAPGFVSAVVTDAKAKDAVSKGSAEYLTNELDHELFTILRVFRSKQDHQKIGHSNFANLQRDKSMKGCVLMTGKDPNSKARLASLLTPTYMMVGIYLFDGIQDEEKSLDAMRKLASVKLQ